MAKKSILFLFLVAGLSSLYIFFGDFFKNPPKMEHKELSPISQQVPKQTSFSQAVALSPLNLEINGPWGNKIASFPTVLFDGQMIALPLRACLGGTNFIIKDGQEKREIVKGYWKKGSSLILWQVKESPEPLRSTTLRSGPWKQDVPVTWSPISGKSTARDVSVVSVRSEGYFLNCNLNERLTDDGILIQDKHLIGWTFVDGQSHCYLWGDTTSENLKNSGIWPDDFYQATFAGGREEHLAKALALPKQTAPSIRLSALLEGLRVSPKLDPADTPKHLRVESIRETMTSLAIEVIATGQYRDLITLFSNPELHSLIDNKSIFTTVYAAVNRYGYESALQLLETIMANSPSQNTSLSSELNSMHMHLFKEWLEKLIADNDTRGGWRLFNEAKNIYPLIPEFQLLGVELALLENDWQQAERLLYAMYYPEELQYKANSLAAIISQRKGQEGRITIQFPAGHKIIPVTAVLNGALKHSFYIDTGATMVTIPLETAEGLGIEIGPDTPQRLVSTAGGVRVANEVTIDSITLGDWVVHDIKAFILDIPNSPKTGLLGLNFLRNFRMDLNTDKGILVLEPL